jgi:hypothetical protein
LPGSVGDLRDASAREPTFLRDRAAGVTTLTEDHTERSSGRAADCVPPVCAALAVLALIASVVLIGWIVALVRFATAQLHAFTAAPPCPGSYDRLHVAERGLRRPAAGGLRGHDEEHRERGTDRRVAGKDRQRRRPTPLSAGPCVPGAAHRCARRRSSTRRRERASRPGPHRLGCWPGYFGEARTQLEAQAAGRPETPLDELEHEVFVGGPRSPVRQAENSRVCRGDPRAAELSVLHKAGQT